MSSPAITPPRIVFLTKKGRCQPEAFGAGTSKKTFDKKDVPQKEINGRKFSSTRTPGIRYHGMISHIFYKTVNVDGKHLSKKSLIKWLNRHETSFFTYLGADETVEGKTVKQFNIGRNEQLKPYFEELQEIKAAKDKKSLETKEQLIVRLNRVVALKGLISSLPKPAPATNPVKAPNPKKEVSDQKPIVPDEINPTQPTENKKTVPKNQPPKPAEKVLPPPQPRVLTIEEKERVKEFYKKKFKKVQKAFVGNMSFDATAARSENLDEFKGKLPKTAPVEKFLKIIDSKLSADSSTAPRVLFKHEVNFRNAGDDSIEGFYYTDSVFREAALEVLNKWEEQEIKDSTLRKNGFEVGQEGYYVEAKKYLIENLKNFYLARDAFDQTFENYKKTPDDDKGSFNYLNEFVKCVFDKNPDLKNDPEKAAEFIKKYIQNDLLMDKKSAKYKESFTKKIEDEWTKCWKATPGLEEVPVNQNRNKIKPKLAFNEKLEFLKKISSLHKEVTKDKIEELNLEEGEESEEISEEIVENSKE